MCSPEKLAVCPNTELKVRCIQARRCEKFLDESKGRPLNVINRNDGANFLAVFSVFTVDK